MRQRSVPEIDHAWPNGTFLSLLSQETTKKLLRLGVIRDFSANHRLLRQGDPGNSVWLLLDALVKVTASVENGHRTLLAIRVSGDVVGEMSVVEGCPRSADVVTCGRAVVCIIKGPLFVEFLRQHPAASFALSQLAIRRLRWANQRRLDFAGYDAPVCLARVLLALAELHGRRHVAGVDIGVPLTQTELGGLVGAKESTVQKALHDIAQLGLARPGHRTVIITDPAGLAAFADLPERLAAEG
jgi:CRP/FNR family transcriptional regulator, cyclic AMP receptor protein